MGMNRWSALTLGILLLAVLLTLASSVQGKAVAVRGGGRQTDTSSSSSAVAAIAAIGTSTLNVPRHHVIRKRNAWWSKRDQSTDESPRISSVEQTENLAGLASEDAIAVDCYSESCVPEFVVCTARSRSSSRRRESTGRSSSDFLQCKLELRLCAKRCFDGIDAARPF